MPKLRSRSRSRPLAPSPAKRSSLPADHNRKCTCGHFGREHANYSKGSCTDPHCQCAVFLQKPKRRKTDQHKHKPSSRASARSRTPYRVATQGDPEFLAKAMKGVQTRLRTSDALRDRVQYLLARPDFRDSKADRQAKHNAMLRDGFARTALHALLSAPNSTSFDAVSITGPAPLLPKDPTNTPEDDRRYNERLADIAYAIAEALMARRLVVR